MNAQTLRFALLCLVLAIALTAPALAACDDPLGCATVGADEPIMLAALLSLSDEISTSGGESLMAVELAIALRDGRLLGRDIELIVENSACDEETAAMAAERIVARSQVIGVIGTSCSLAARAALPVISEAGLLMISPSNTSPSLTDADHESGGLHRPGYFRTAHNDLALGAVAAEFARTQLGAASVATVDDGDPYTAGLAGAMARDFSALGGTVVYRGQVRKSQADMSAILAEIAAIEPDVLYLPLFRAEAELLIAGAAETPGLEDSVIMTDRLDQAMFQALGESSLGVFVSAPMVAGEAYDKHVATWTERFGSPPAFNYHAHAFDAANLLLDAVEAVAISDDAGSLRIGRSALRAAIAAVDAYPGASGLLTCREDSPYRGDCGSESALSIFEIRPAVIDDGLWLPPLVWAPAE